MSKGRTKENTDNWRNGTKEIEDSKKEREGEKKMTFFFFLAFFLSSLNSPLERISEGWTIRHIGIRYISWYKDRNTYTTTCPSNWVIRSVWKYQELLLKQLGRIQDLNTHPAEYGDGRFHLCAPCPWSPEGMCTKLQIQVTLGRDLLRSSVRWQLCAGDGLS